ncbi:F17F8.18 [Arabidopsis thaliana]|uniref:F17F8.18 n=1 Tax=Arabidopsis thaliana TaxID=3702 RepID=Q9FYI2_ARATH|nr:F17F8.18 [Arabidopsis thaliana]
MGWSKIEVEIEYRDKDRDELEILGFIDSVQSEKQNDQPTTIFRKPNLGNNYSGPMASLAKGNFLDPSTEKEQAINSSSRSARLQDQLVFKISSPSTSAKARDQVTDSSSSLETLFVLV